MSDLLSYTDVKNADLAPLKEAIDKWNLAPGKFQQVGTNFGTDVTQGLANSDWEGDTADAAWKKLRAVEEQITAAAEEARRVHGVLDEAHKQFSWAKKELEAIVTEVAEYPDLTVNTTTDGAVRIKDGTKNAGQLNKAYQETFAVFRDRTRKAIQAASDADSALVAALTADPNGEDRGFNSNAYDSLDAARKAVGQDLSDAVRLAGIGNGRMTSDQLHQLNLLMSRHSADPEFAEQFATRLGPEKTLQLWYNATHPRNPLYPDTKIDEKAWWKDAKALQQSLGTTLATASHSDSPEMRKWKEDVIRMGSERLESSGGRTHPYGFQIMSNLMRFGQYDSAFLGTYGDKLVAWDRKNNTKGPFPYWTNTADSDALNLNGRKDDTGHDPVTGFLEGLGHNPEAATEFFKQPTSKDRVEGDADLNSHLKYLTQTRNWDFDGVAGNGPQDLPGHEALGHALTAATTGYAWDAPEVSGRNPDIYPREERRTAAAADVMEQVVHTYGGKNGPRLLHDQPGIAGSLGAMGAAYVDDLNRNVGGFGDRNVGESPDAYPVAYQGHADFGRTGAIGFLTTLGHNETAHGIMNQAEHLYTMDRLAHNPANGGEHSFDTGIEVLKTEAEVRGILDHSRAAQITATYDAQSAEAQKAFQDSSGWTRVGFSAGAPALAAGIVNVVGKAGPWGVAVPIVMGGATEFAKVFHSDAVFGGPHMPPPVDESQFYQRGEDDLSRELEQYLKGYRGKTDGMHDPVDTIKQSYWGLQGEARGLGQKPIP
ncbi:hypothetical protein [Streptomyces palmae]|uniref:Uncharacterized protein n=1 Tax=Streptomyces palmae TaxID=1701085 RepID=A0A4Z0HF35_9ACTN|nr:hypothetical protein [Streptomyces palmae]TGB16810.1 hypothetical protein E4099_04510 [Streptomyces palmae]